METVIQEAAQYFSVISVTGARQSGKSTMLKHLFPDLPQWTSTPIARRAVVYGGNFENTTGYIQVIRYNHLKDFVAEL